MWSMSETTRNQPPVAMTVAGSEATGGAMQTNAMQVTVTSALFLGEIMRIEARTSAGETLLIRCTDRAGRPLPNVGEELHVRWGAEDCWVLA